MSETEAYKIPKWFIGFVAFVIVVSASWASWLSYSVVQISTRMENSAGNALIMQDHTSQLITLRSELASLKEKVQELRQK